MERIKLRELELAGGRRLVRNILFYGLSAVAALGALGYLLPAHRLENDATFHSNYADGGPAALLVFGGAIACLLLLRRLRFGAGIVAGIVSMGAAIGALMPVFLVHLFSHVDHAAGESLYALGVLGLFCGGVALLIAEPILYLTQRRALQRARDAELPKLPIARVV
ncbi:MAG TPA: hypothetical protein VFQ53_29720 [Kofleriaceae bacterium]|nr:hypothetical protein [Kofleriaceae bacterium]